MDLLNLCSTQNDRRNVLILGSPRQSQVCRGASQLLSNLGQLAHLLNLGLALLGAQSLGCISKEVLVGGETRIFGDAVVVLAGEETAGQRTPDSSTVAQLVKQRLELNLKALTVEGIVLRLLGHGGNEVVLLGQTGSLHDLRGRPLTGSPVVGEVQVANSLCEAFDNLEHGRANIGAVSKDHVNIRGLQTGQARLEALNDVLAGQTASVGLLATSAKEDLGDEDVLITGPVELLQGIAHLDLASTVGVNLSSVKGLLRVSKSGSVCCEGLLGLKPKSQMTVQERTHDAIVPSSLEDVLDN